MKFRTTIAIVAAAATLSAGTAEAAGFCMSVMPISTSGLRINSGFGVQRNLSKSMGWHMGLDLSDAAGCGQGRKGEPVKAGFGGTLERHGSAAARSNGGLYAIVRNGNYSAIYMHLQDIVYETGKSVAAGDVIGHCGDTGAWGSPHLHLGMLASGSVVNSFGDQRSFRFGQSKLGSSLTASAIHDASPTPLYLVNPENFLPQSLPYASGGQSGSCSGGAAPPIDTSTSNPEKPPTSQSAGSPKKDMAAGEASARSGDEGVIASQAALERRGVVVDIAKTMALDLRTNDTEEQDAIDSAQAHMLLLALDPKRRPQTGPVKQAEAATAK